MVKKNVLFISSGFGSSPVLSGGETRLFNLIERKPVNWSVSFLTSSGGALASANYFKKKPFNEILVARNYFLFSKEYFAFQRLLGYFISAFDSIKNMRFRDYDAMYTSSDSFCDVYPAFIYKNSHNRVKWFCMLHHKYISPLKRPGFFIVNFVLYWLQLQCFKMIAKRADYVFVLETDEGELIAQTLRGLGYRGAIERVKNGIPRVSGLKAIPKNNKLAVYVGGLRASKGLYDLVPIWRKVNEANPGLKLEVIGKGNDRDTKYLINDIRRQHLENSIRLEGYIDAKRLAVILARSFLFFLPSHEEGWGISIMDALQKGCHVVVYDLPAFKIFKKELSLIPSFDREKYAREILRVFSEKKQKKINKKFLNQFYWDDIAKKEIKIINSML